MDRRDFDKLAFPFKIMESKAMNISGFTLKVTFVRYNLMNLVYSDNLIITPKRIYYNDLIKEWMEMTNLDMDSFMDMIINSKDGEYTYESTDMMYLDKARCTEKMSTKCISMGNFPDYSLDVRNKLKLNTFPNKYEWYTKMVWSVSTKKNQKMCRYCLTNEELDEFLMYNLEDWDYPYRKSKENLLDMVQNNMKVRDLLRQYQETVFEFKPSRRKEATLTLKSDYQTFFSEYQSETLTYSRLKYWEMTRHNLFGEIVCELMGWDYDERFDVNMTDKFGYWGRKYYQTPDMVLEEDNKVKLIDFAVTNANAGTIRDFKKTKYEDLREGLSQFLTKDVSVDAIVWKINSDFEFQIPPEYTDLNNLLRFDERMIKIKELQIGFQLMKDYQRFKSMLDREGEDEENEDESMLEVSENLYKILDSRMSHAEKLRCIPVENSRLTEPNLNAKPKMFKDTEFYSEIKEFNSRFDEVRYTDYLTKELQEMVEKNEMNQELENVFNFTPEELEIQAEKIMEEEMIKRNKFEADSNNSIPSIFKFPLMEFSRVESKNMRYFNKETPDFWNSVHYTDDGTYYYTSTMDYKIQKMQEDSQKNLPYNIDGIGINPEEDSNMIETLIDYFSEEDSDATKKATYEDYANVDPMLQEVLKSKLWTYVCSVGELMENLCYMESRRHIFDSSKGHTIFKNFGEYMILMKKGSKITQEKQVRYKIYLPDDIGLNPKKGLFKNLIKSPESMYLNCTKWLSITVADIKHFIKIREVVLAMFSNYKDKMMEENRASGLTTSLLTKSMVTQCLVLLEHRRGTSTSSQLSRYLLNSVTSFASNRLKLLDDIMSDPIRSRLEAYIRNTQMNWYVYCMKMSNDIWFKRILDMASTSTDYDRFKLPSFYDLDQEVEFSVLMDEIYTCNLFEKTAGFQSHRLKRIVEKMSVAEIHFHKVKKMGRSKGKMDSIKKFLMSKDELHMFSRKVVVSATRKYFNSSTNKVKIMTAFLESFSEVIDGAMMMTSSLESGPLSSEAILYNSEIVKSKSFITIYKSVMKLSTNNLMLLCEKLDLIDAIFTIFPKDQIGGAREILIQSIMTRLFVKYLETLSKKLCKKHGKEMLTKDKKKAEIQADRMTEYRELLKMLRQKGEHSIYASLNSDASKWAPGFVMEHFMYFVSNWGLDNNTESLMLSILSSFSNKKIMVPESLKKKWSKKDNSEIEHLEGVQYMREESDKNWGTVLVNSGMGQGMLHFLSSLYHCIMDDYMEEITEKIMARVFSVNIHQTSLISSDDKTKMFIMVFRDGVNQADRVLKSYLMVVDWMSRLTNIHTNWKKSGLNFVITEFNSLFSVGKRMQWATIKDIYTANSVPDLSSPEEAVVFMNSNIRRCLEHGVYLTTIKLMMHMARNQIMRYYRVDKNLVTALCKVLNCKEEQLPFQLGFYNCSLPVETLLYGLEVTMWDRDLSDELKKFYKNIYSHNPGENYKTSKKNVPFSEVCAGKYWYELPMRLDKRLANIRNEFFDEDLGMNPESLMLSSNHRKLNYNSPYTDMRHFETFTEEFFIGMRRRYEFQETMVVHSLIRALQVTTNKGQRYPMTEKEEETLEEYRNSSKNYEFKKRKGTLRDEDVDFFLEKKKQIESFSMDLLSFCMKIMDINTNLSALSMYSGMKEIVDIHYEVIDQMQNMEKSKKYSHATMRTMRFYMTDIGMSASKEEIVDFMFNRNKDFRTTTINTLEKIMKQAGMEMTPEVFLNPFLTIKNMTKSAMYPNKVFMEYLHLNYRSMKFLKINMLSDLPCEGNMRSNLLNYYRTKTDPSCFFMPKDNDFLREETSLEFLTAISLNKPLKMMEIPDHYKKITTGDNLFMKTMKLHSISKGDWKGTMEVAFDRIEYNKLYSRERDTHYYSWSTLHTLVKIEETKKNLYVNINSDVDFNLTNSEDKILMVIKRFMMEKLEEDKKITFLNRTNKTNDNKIYYRLCPMHWKTLINRTMTMWNMSLIVEAGLDTGGTEMLENMNRTEFKMFKDSYTVDSRSLMELEIIDEYDDIRKVKELYLEIPDLVALDKIFIKNNWIKEIVMNVNEEVSGKVKYQVQELNKSFGITSLDTTISNLFGGSEAWTKIKKIKDENMDGSTNLLSSVDNVDIGMLEMPETNTLHSLAKALKVIEENETSLVLEFNPYERNSITKNVDYLVSQSMKTSLVINKDMMKNFYKYSKSSKVKLQKFHDLMLWQIQKALDFEISDTMAIIIYNHILKSSTTILNAKPSDKLKKLSKDLTMSESIMFITTYVTYNEDLEKIFDQM